MLVIGGVRYDAGRTRVGVADARAATPTESRTEADGPQPKLSRQAWGGTAMARGLLRPLAS